MGERLQRCKNLVIWVLVSSVLLTGEASAEELEVYRQSVPCPASGADTTWLPGFMRVEGYSLPRGFNFATCHYEGQASLVALWLVDPQHQGRNCSDSRWRQIFSGEASAIRYTFNDRQSGIGAELEKPADSLQVMEVFPGSPAQKAGLRIGDHIVMVNGQSVRSLSLRDAVALFRGEMYSRIAVRRHRPEYYTDVDLEIVREPITQYIQHITVFSKSSIAWTELSRYGNADEAAWLQHAEGLLAYIEGQAVGCPAQRSGDAE